MSYINKIETYMINIYFYNAPDVEEKTTKEHWIGHIRTIEKVIPINSKCKNKINVLIDVEILRKHRTSGSTK